MRIFIDYEHIVIERKSRYLYGGFNGPRGQTRLKSKISKALYITFFIWVIMAMTIPEVIITTDSESIVFYDMRRNS